MFIRLYRVSMAGLCLLFASGFVQANDAMITWPEGWQIEAMPPEADATGKPAAQFRQRAVKNDQAGNPMMVMELTQSTLVAGHQVNVEGVLLEMRKAIQVMFARSGFQSVCTRARQDTLSQIPALETTCTITQNGVHVMTQTLVAAATKDMAWSLSYAGSAEGYAATKEEARRIRDSVRIDGSQ
ncbi:DUF4946 domain-containing protein [Pseudomonas sp. CFII64]|uniref:DUF4946 domain-containing protein n=1 Tax=Pseudomonas syringae TaxID=317 RepID=A0A085V5X0_PSESX|nr:hypothetical protein CFII64_26578 [Pseudomonas sp. CFII64]KFE50833.1 hypothetical protein IV02_15525 [Pseudomonas syringae]